MSQTDIRGTWGGVAAGLLERMNHVASPDICCKCHGVNKAELSLLYLAGSDNSICVLFS